MAENSATLYTPLAFCSVGHALNSDFFSLTMKDIQYISGSQNYVTIVRLGYFVQHWLRSGCPARSKTS